jgi:ABC-type multidrug transport system ATPase subunit
MNVLARRTATAGAVVEGETFINGSGVSNDIFQQVSSYVEQEDALIGSLTVKETMHFAARLAHQK